MIGSNHGSDKSSAPVQDEIEYEVRVFSQGFQPQVTEYWGPPTEKTNKLWKDLYDCKSLVSFSFSFVSSTTSHTGLSCIDD